MTQPQGYSGTPLPKKLGLKDGQAVAFIGLPDAQADLPHAAAFAFVENVAVWQDLRQKKLDFIHFFTKSAEEVERGLAVLKMHIKPDGMIWVSWPKKASNVKTDVTEDTIRNCALADVLVDVKVCAVDQIWSGLKLVIRKELRAGLN